MAANIQTVCLFIYPACSHLSELRNAIRVPNVFGTRI